MSEKNLHHNQPETLFHILTKKPYEAPKKLFESGFIFMLQCWTNAKIGEFNIALLKTLSSYQEHLMFKAPGTQVQEPQSLFDCVGLILLTHIHKNKLKQEFETLNEFEKNMELF